MLTANDSYLDQGISRVDLDPLTLVGAATGGVEKRIAKACTLEDSRPLALGYNL